jgi:Family of unknown function (DUF6370)
MKTASKWLVGLTVVLMVGFIARANDKPVTEDGKDGGSRGQSAPAGSAAKAVTLKGTITCAKCDLKLQSKCNTVIKTKKDGKDVVVYFDKDSNKKYHGDTCMGAKEGSVTGIPADKDDKHWISVTKLEYAK